MKYLTERSLYYYFLMRGVADAEGDCWGFVSKAFGVKPKTARAYEAALADPTLDELSTVGDAEMYKNYVNGFCCPATEFGKTDCESEALDAKTLALHKISALFGESPVAGGRLRSLSHIYEGDHVASVLYALQILYLNDDAECVSFAENILVKEFEEGKNSDAGLILLRLKDGDVNETASRLKGLPDMLLRPDMLKYLVRQYGGGDVVIKNKRTIGF